MKLPVLTALIAVALLGAGCSARTQTSTNMHQMSDGTMMHNDDMPMDGSAWENEDIDADIKAAAQLDVQQAQRDRDAYEADMRAQEKDFAETPESAGVTFEE